MVRLSDAAVPESSSSPGSSDGTRTHWASPGDAPCPQPVLCCFSCWSSLLFLPTLTSRTRCSQPWSLKHEGGFRRWNEKAEPKN